MDMDAFVQKLESSPWEAFWQAGVGSRRGGWEKPPPGRLASSLVSCEPQARWGMYPGTLG